MVDLGAEAGPEDGVVPEVWAVPEGVDLAVRVVLGAERLAEAVLGVAGLEVWAGPEAEQPAWAGLEAEVVPEVWAGPEGVDLEAWAVPGVVGPGAEAALEAGAGLGAERLAAVWLELWASVVGQKQGLNGQKQLLMRLPGALKQKGSGPFCWRPFCAGASCFVYHLYRVTI